MNNTNNTTDSAKYVADVELYHSAFCPYCSWAKTLLDSKNFDYKIYNVDSDANIRQEARDRSNRHTIPQIFINGQSIGGFDELNAMERRGVLDEALMQSGDEAPFSQ